MGPAGACRAQGNTSPHISRSFSSVNPAKWPAASLRPKNRTPSTVTAPPVDWGRRGIGNPLTFSNRY
jgi:hypothetical protein